MLKQIINQEILKKQWITLHYNIKADNGKIFWNAPDDVMRISEGLFFFNHTKASCSVDKLYDDDLNALQDAIVCIAWSYPHYMYKCYVYGNFLMLGSTILRRNQASSCASWIFSIQFYLAHILFVWTVGSMNEQNRTITCKSEIQILKKGHMLVVK